MDDYRVGFHHLLARSMSSSEVRMTPRPAKAPAWSVPPLGMSSPMDDPSSCSDNASDHSDKMENFCSGQNQNNGNNHNNNNSIGSNPQHQQQLTPHNQGQGGQCKTRKRKIIGGSSGGMSGLGSNNAYSTSSGGNNGGNGGGSGGDIKDIHGNHHSQQNGQSVQGSLWAEAESLAADFDGSLSGLGTDLTTTSYDMSEALLALPTLYHQHRNAAAAAAAQQTSNTSGFLKEAGLTPLSAAHLHGGSSVSLPGDFHFEPHSTSPCHPTSTSAIVNAHNGLDCERRFQYVLAAATSIATKVNEETLTYLNQGQPYEIKLKKLGDLTAYRGVQFRSVVRLCFHDRRLQFSEREQITQWEDSHLNDRILQVDLPLSYGVTMCPISADLPSNQLSFIWEPLKEVGLYIKVNCISTEFTPKKHGGEKGVPFRLMIETFAYPDGMRLHASACQVKVFKLKGADRKHKQDREKIIKKTPGEQAKLQPSYECTVLSDISLESLDHSPPPPMQNQQQNGGGGNNYSPTYSSEHQAGGESPENPHSSGLANGVGVGSSSTGSGGGCVVSSNTHPYHFSAHLSPESVRRWLIRNRFTSTKTLWDFSGLDLLRLTKEELIEMCGLAEGIRLFNALHYKITFYIMLNHLNDPLGENQNGVDEILYHPVCLSSPSLSELLSVIGSLFGTTYQSDHLPVERLFLSVTSAPTNARIRVVLTEQLLTTLKDQTAFKAVKNGTEVCLEIVEQ